MQRNSTSIELAMGEASTKMFVIPFMYKKQGRERITQHIRQCLVKLHFVNEKKGLYEKRWNSSHAGNTSLVNKLFSLRICPPCCKPGLPKFAGAAYGRRGQIEREIMHLVFYLPRYCSCNQVKNIRDASKSDAATFI